MIWEVGSVIGQLLPAIETPATADLNLLLAGCLQDILLFIIIIYYFVHSIRRDVRYRN